ncbi:hypothetical protein K438DRAFT_2015204 [Mycena galopus ATCC 62051]|nr:hypothetical protein K438DRAFT_2031290 [Mycena galopus ATCC 62051]KAF8203587.1 hypothetical protein K438DRAFT_2015204 [Mycena galopus ATCC 62051]
MRSSTCLHPRHQQNFLLSKKPSQKGNVNISLRGLTTDYAFAFLIKKPALPDLVEYHVALSIVYMLPAVTIKDVAEEPDRRGAPPLVESHYILVPATADVEVAAVTAAMLPHPFALDTDRISSFWPSALPQDQSSRPTVRT